jgi:O-antigen/teichoic acid export membrane protein
LSLFNAVNSSFFQGLQNFICIGVLGLLSPILKIIISVGLIFIGLNLNGALLGVASSLGLIFLVGSLILLRQLPNSDIKITFKIKNTSIKQAYPVLFATIATAAMTQLDMVLVNWYFPAREAGLYAAASVLGKAILYLPGGLIVILFPVVSELKARGQGGSRIFRQAVIATFICCSAISLIYFLFGDEIIQLLYGDSYSGAGEILKWYGFAILPMALVLVAEHYLIAKGQVLFAWLFLAIAPLQILAISLWHTQIWMILAIMGIFGALVLFIGYIYMYLNGRPSII